ncbi:MAG: hypothetical protein IK124_07315 [Prevotella sp.]|nr:hypothetical protein [Prevotella sp.]
MNRVFSYKALYDYTLKKGFNGLDMNIYIRYKVQTLKKDITLMTVPSMHVLARGKDTEYFGETYTKLKFKEFKDYEFNRQISVGTVPRYKQTMPTLVEYMIPNLYDVSLINNRLLSPFHFKNKVFYRYGISFLTDDRVEIVFRPKKRNTQVVSGKAIVDYHTGRIQMVEFSGEYDMITFHVTTEMGDQVLMSFFPKKCQIEADFRYMKNHIRTSQQILYSMADIIPDSISNSHDMTLMEQVRPIPLPYDFQQAYERYDSIHQFDSLRPPKKRSVWKRVLWDYFGDNLVNRIKGSFGPNDQGSFRISPILNPLYVSYSGRRGITYKMKIRSNYAFSDNTNLSFYTRMGYSFKQKQFYFTTPIRFTFNKKRHGYVELEVGNGNRIRNKSVREYATDEENDSTYKHLMLDYFKDTKMRLITNYDISDRWSISAGTTFHRRSAVDKAAFQQIGQPDTYHTFAPMIETQIRPWSWHGPMFTINYEQGIKGVGKSDMNYGRLEVDANWLRPFSRLRSLSMRLGFGMYTMKDKEEYFLDFENFRDEYMLGWNDDWTGEFQLLKQETYNSSDYYVRSNITYESPLLLLSNLPHLGHFVETERIYVNTLLLQKVHPYNEFGYGLKNRYFSFGLFVGIKNFRYDGIGCKVGFELFRDW